MERVNPEFIEANLGLVGKVVRDIYCPLHVEKEDLFQEGVLALYLAATKFDPGRGVAFSSFAYMCILNKLRNYIRSQKSNLYIEDLYYQPKVNQVMEEEKIELKETVNTLPLKEKEVIQLLFYQNHTLETAGNKLGVSHTTVARRRDKALKLLQKVC